MSLIRRSHFSGLFPNAPSKAPQHAEVQDWLRSELQHTHHPKPLEHVARLMEKAIARELKALDLSTADPMALRKLPASLIKHLSRGMARLRLPDDCPPDVVTRWLMALPQIDITPQYLAPASRTKRAFIRRAGLPPEQRRMQTKVEPPRVPDLKPLPLPSDLPHSDELRDAAQALQPVRAWLKLHADAEGQNSRTSLSSGDADAIAKALLLMPSGLPDSEKSAFMGSRGLLAARPRNAPLILTSDQARSLSRALLALEVRAAPAG